MPRGPNVKLEEFEIPEGGEISCVHDHSIKATIIDGKLIFLGNEVSLSKIVKYTFYKSKNKNDEELDISSMDFKRLPWWGFNVHESLFYDGERLFDRRKRIKKEKLIAELKKYHEK